ncbi:MAG: helix-turn-helix transcriptional regulator [Chthoniobacterales bacterium]
MHSHPVIEMVYHPRGSGVTTLEGGRKIAFEAHGTVIYPACVRHDQQMFTLGDDICIHLEDPYFRTEGTTFPEAIYIPPGGGQSRRADPYVRTEFLHLAWVRADASRQLELSFRVSALVARLLQLKQPLAQKIPPTLPEVYLTRARQHIAENYGDIRSVAEVAKHVGISVDYLRHLFAEHGATSINRLLNQTRLERAKELLIHSQLPIKEIARLSGFETERYLCTRFRKLTGTSPGAFRLQATKTFSYTHQ